MHILVNKSFLIEEITKVINVKQIWVNYLIKTSFYLCFFLIDSMRIN